MAPPLYGLVLAGGRSTRMQRDKATLSYQGKNQLDRAMDLLDPHVAQAFVSVRADQRADPARVVARLYLPGEELHRARSRASQVVGRVMSLPEEEVERLAAGLLRDFSDRHHDYQGLLRRNASNARPRASLSWPKPLRFGFNSPLNTIHS